MAQPITYFHQRDWANASQDYTFPPIVLVDDAQQTLTAVSGLWLTLYDPLATDSSVVNGLNRTNIRSTSRASMVEGKLMLHLTQADLAPLHMGSHEQRHVLIEYSYAGGSKVSTVEIQFVIRHVPRFPSVLA